MAVAFPIEGENPIPCALLNRKRKKKESSSVRVEEGGMRRSLRVGGALK